MMSKFSQKITCKTVQTVAGTVIGLGIFYAGKQITENTCARFGKTAEPIAPVSTDTSPKLR